MFHTEPISEIILYFDKSKCRNSRWSPSAISIVFIFDSSDPLFLLKFTSETRFEQYLLILYGAFEHISTKDHQEK